MLGFAVSSVPCSTGQKRAFHLGIVSVLQSPASHGFRFCDVQLAVSLGGAGLSSLPDPFFEKREE